MLEIGRPQENWRVLSPTIGRHYVRNFNLPVGKWRRPPCVVIRCDDGCSIIIQWSPGGLCEVCGWVNNSNKLTMWSFFFRFHFALLPFLCAFSLPSVSSLSPRFGLGLTQRLCSTMARVRRAQRWRCSERLEILHRTHSKKKQKTRISNFLLFLLFALLFLGMMPVKVSGPL